MKSFLGESIPPNLLHIIEQAGFIGSEYFLDKFAGYTKY